MFSVTGGNCHRPKGQRFSHGGTGAVQSVKRNTHFCNPEGGGNGLGKQVTGKGHADVRGSQSCLSYSQNSGFLLKSAFCCFPCFCSKERVLRNHVKKVSQRAFSFFFACDRSCAFDIYGLFKRNAGASCQFSGSHAITSISLRI